jgi:hypothetical protein
MTDPIVHGFPRSTYVNIVRLVLTHKDVPYVFHDLETVGQARASCTAPVQPRSGPAARRFHGLRDQRHCFLRR